MKSSLFILISLVLFGCMAQPSGMEESLEIEGPVDCGSDMECFIEQSETCGESKIVFTSEMNIFGIVQTTTSSLELNGAEDDKCLFHIGTESIDVEFSEELRNQMLGSGVPEQTIDEQEEIARNSTLPLIGREGDCKFDQADLTSMLLRWKDGNFSFGISGDEITGDFENAECTGSYFSTDIEGTGEAPSDEIIEEPETEEEPVQEMTEEEKEDAQHLDAITTAEQVISEAKSMGTNTIEAEALLQEAQDAYEIKDFAEVQDLTQQALSLVSGGGAVIHGLNCVVPRDGLVIEQDTTFCTGTYYLEINHSDKHPSTDWRPLVLMNTSDVVLDCNDATLIHSSPTPGASTAIGIFTSEFGPTPNHYELDNIVVKNCNIAGFLHGVYIENNIANSPIIQPNFQRSDGLDYASYIHDITIEDNEIDTTQAAVRIYYARDVVVENNMLAGEWGVGANYAPDLLVKDNIMDGGGVNINQPSDGARIESNTISKGRILVKEMGISIIDNILIYSENPNPEKWDNIGIAADYGVCTPGPGLDVYGPDEISGNVLQGYVRAIISNYYQGFPHDNSTLSKYESQNTFINTEMNVTSYQFSNPCP